MKKDNKRKTEPKPGLVPISEIKKSPENDKLYKPITGRERDIRKLAKSIRKHGLLEPLIISQDDYILSGHRRFEACKLARLREVMCIRTDILHDDPQFINQLREYNRQRVKSNDELIREQVLDVNEEDSYKWLLEHRKAKATIEVNEMEIGDERTRPQISKAKAPFLDAVMKVFNERKAYLPLSDRQIHYALLNHPPLRHASKPKSIYGNNLESYKSLVDLLTRARVEGTIPHSWISDETRPVATWSVYPSIEPFVSEQLEEFLTGYRRDYMQSQPCHIEIVGEKNTIQGTVRKVAMEFFIPYTIGRGYCSLAPRQELVERFEESGKEDLILLFLSDFDPDGEEIAQSFARSIRDDFHITPTAIKVALNHEQVSRMTLPSKMTAKKTSSNYKKFVGEHGKAVYELEAIPPKTLEDILREAINSVIGVDLFNKELTYEKRDSKDLFARRKLLLDTTIKTDGEVE